MELAGSAATCRWNCSNSNSSTSSIHGIDPILKGGSRQDQQRGPRARVLLNRFCSCCLLHPPPLRRLRSQSQKAIFRAWARVVGQRRSRGMQRRKLTFRGEGCLHGFHLAAVRRFEQPAVRPCSRRKKAAADFPGPPSSRASVLCRNIRRSSADGLTIKHDSGRT